MPVNVNIPIRLRVDPRALTERLADVEEAMMAAVGRSLNNSRDVVLESRGGYVQVTANSPKFTWLGEAMSLISTVTRARIEARIAAVLSDAVNRTRVRTLAHAREENAQPLMDKAVEQLDRGRVSTQSRTYTLPSYQEAAEISIPLGRAEGANQFGASRSEVRSFAALWDEYESRRRRWETRFLIEDLPILEAEGNDPLELVPDLIASMNPRDSFAHALDLALWLLYRGETSLAEETLAILFNNWLRSESRIDWLSLPNVLPNLVDPERLVREAETEARANHHSIAQHFLRIAYVICQSHRLYHILSANQGQYGSQSYFWGMDPFRISALLGWVQNLYPELAQDALRQGDIERARELEAIGQALIQDLFVNFTPGQALAHASSISTPSRPFTSRPETSQLPTGVTEGRALTSASITEFEDRVEYVPPPFEGALVLRLPSDRYIFVHSDRHAITNTIAHAAFWGRVLFGTVSSVIVARQTDTGSIYYFVAGLDTDVPIIPMGRFAPNDPRGRIYGVLMDRLANGYQVVTVVIGGRYYLYRTEERRMELEAQLGPELARFEGEVPAGIPLELVRTHVFGEIDRLISTGEETNLRDAVRRLSELNAEAFRVLDTESRVRYLTILLDAWTYWAEERAIVEIIKSVPDRLELDAIFDQIKQVPGLWDKLFDDLDHELWSLLVVLGERFASHANLTLDEFFQILLETRLISIPIGSGITIGPSGPVIGIDVLVEVERRVRDATEAARSLMRTGEAILDAVIMLISHPRQVLEGIGQLIRMVIMAQLARLGYLPAMEELNRFVTPIGRQLIFGVQGALITGESGRFLLRIKWAIIWEVASMFVGVGEIQAVLRAVNLTERTASMARLVSLLGLAGRLAEGEQVTVKLSRLAGLFNRSSRALASEEQVLRLLSHLPEEQAAHLARLLDDIEIDEATTLTRLTDTNPEAGARISTALRQAETLNELSVKAGGLSTEVIDVFQRLIREQGDDAFEIIQLIQSDQGISFIRAVRAIPPQVSLSGRTSGDMLRALAENPTIMDALPRIGYDAFNAAYTRVGRNTQLLDDYLEALTLGGNLETQELLRANETLRRSLLEHPFAARALRRCNTPCYPPNATPDQIARIDRLLRRVSGTEQIDFELLTTYFHDLRNRLDDATHALESLERAGPISPQRFNHFTGNVRWSGMTEDEFRTFLERWAHSSWNTDDVIRELGEFGRIRYRNMSDLEIFRRFTDEADDVAAAEIARRYPSNPYLQRILGSDYRPPHTADVIYRRGTSVVERTEIKSAGNGGEWRMTQDERALGFPRSMQATHTEARAVRQLKQYPEVDFLDIRGQYNPCGSCRAAMQQAATETGATIRYWWQGGEEIFRP